MVAGWEVVDVVTSGLSLGELAPDLGDVAQSALSGLPAEQESDVSVRRRQEGELLGVVVGALVGCRGLRCVGVVLLGVVGALIS